MNKFLPIFIVLLLALGLGGFKLSTVLAQTSDSTTSDFTLDIAQGEKDTANDVDAQNNQQGVNQDEEVQAAADDGDPSSEPVAVIADQMIAPEETQESGQLVENPQATTSENDNGEILKDQTTQSSNETPNQDVNTQDDNKASVLDAEKQPQATQAPQEQSLENLPSVEPQGQDQQTSGSSTEGSNISQ